MKRVALLCMVLVAPILMYAQKITAKYDPFLKQTRLESGWTGLHGGISKMLQIKIRSVGSTIIFKLNGVGSEIVGTDDKLMFLLEDGEVVTAYSKEIQSYTVGQYANSWMHEYMVDPSGLEILSKKKVMSVRKYTSDGYYDTEVPEKNRKNFLQLSGKFLAELSKTTAKNESTTL